MKDQRHKRGTSIKTKGTDGVIVTETQDIIVYIIYLHHLDFRPLSPKPRKWLQIGETLQRLAD
jgi:hypothetical protein